MLTHEQVILVPREETDKIPKKTTKKYSTSSRYEGCPKCFTCTISPKINDEVFGYSHLKWPKEKTSSPTGSASVQGHKAGNV